ncbi:hypothetical protein L6164_025016 [Bauhinia variegata]|uniref:Uncharacterized protein n=1 Tax=Bauhinia variegata TaxID=167791 RepID=A0ACB9LZC9_BAUVA|nr:hypothetical protein L6164_025016 [Bauhinia variegata]
MKWNIVEDEQPQQLKLSVESRSEQLKSHVHDEQLWGSPFSHGLYPCVKPTAKYKGSQGFDHYLTVRSNGGLNQMRTGISDMVGVAHIMNATLVIPQLDKRSFWQDSSVFSDIFDELHFIESLKGDVRIVKELPKNLEGAPRARKHFTSWSSVGYYEEMKRLWNDYQVVHVAKSDSRLANNNLPLDIQKLRCRALYQALQFSPPIESLGKVLSMPDSEKTEVGEAAEITAENYEGEHKTLEAGDIYGGNTHLSELSSRFSNLVFKESLATPEELKAFTNHASQWAALDYIISVESDVFAPSYSGNMARAVEGHRRFLGHRRTISPDRKGLVEIFDKLETGELEEGPSLSNLVQRMHKNRQGAPRKRHGSLPGIKGRARFRTEEAFYENPYPECICGSKKEREIT